MPLEERKRIREGVVWTFFALLSVRCPLATLQWRIEPRFRFKLLLERGAGVRIQCQLGSYLEATIFRLSYSQQLSLGNRYVQLDIRSYKYPFFQ